MLQLDTLLMKYQNKSVSSNNISRYKALMIDVDGTLVPNEREGMPSEKVVAAIAEASKLLRVGIATSRPIFLVQHIIDHLKLSGPSIINGGGQVIDIGSKKVFYREPIEKKDVSKTHQITKRHNVLLRLDTDEEEIPATDKLDTGDILGMFIPALDLLSVEKLRKEIDATPTLSTHVAPSWTKGKWTISVSHAKATKQHAIFEIAKVLGITTDEIIGVGDGGNDFPLLMACGFKVAMGNAVPDLKAIADYIAPSVEEDGVADVIQKFVLN